MLSNQVVAVEFFIIHHAIWCRMSIP